VSRLGTAVATVLVGQSEQPLSVHRELLASSSDFFKKALNGNFLEHNSVVRLTDREPGTFDIYVKWLYSCYMCTKAELIIDNAGKRSCAEWPNLSKCYILGDLIQDYKFRNTSVDAMIESILAERTFPAGLASTVCDSHPPGSSMQKLLIDMWVHASSPTWSERTAGELVSGPAMF
jgi:hypothetical protein